jgi:hypothetical protein
MALQEGCIAGCDHKQKRPVSVNSSTEAQGED